ncbi:MAG: beta-N-acetylhexosaminidase, partial [Alloprevotella sp.]
MKKAFFALLLAFGGTLAVQAEVNPKPFVVPELTSWQGAEGRFVPSGRIVVPSNKSLRVVAERFAADYATMFGRKLTLVSGDAQAGDFVFSLQKDVAERPLGKEGYVLRIGKTTHVSAVDVQGAFWATRTLLQLSEQNRSHTLPCGTTTDIPAYALRGFMIDCGRKFIPMDYLNKLVSVMAYYKMNTLQVHLNDNGFKQYFGNDWNKTQSAFRLESNFFPGLTAKDGSYTKREFIDFQKRAEQQYVDIVPEIDVPAHSLAFSHYRPSLGSK